MKSSSAQGTVFRASLRRTVPRAGEAATTAPISATTAGGTRCRGSLHQSATTVASSRAQRVSAGSHGPETGCSLWAWRSSTVMCTGPSRSARRVVVKRTTSAARWDEATASGSPSSSHWVKPMRSPVASQSTDTVIRWAPAPISVATAESRMTVGKSSASITTRRLRSARTLARARKTGRASAARPEVAGTAKAVTTRAAVVRCVNCRTLRAPLTRKAAARPASPLRATAAASTKAQISSHTVSSPRVPKRVSLLITPVAVRASPAPSAM
ncbi:hypothetical protein SALBM135S_02449 [Streptomyces alboniger]